jgi:hypothetical protein
LAFVDSDDFLEVNSLEILWAATEGGRFDIVECGYNTISSEGRILSSQVPSPRRHETMASAGSCLLATNPSFWNKLWRRDLFISNDIFFPEKIYWEDLATVPRLVAAAANMNVIDQVCYNYFDRAESYTNAAGAKHLYDYLKVFEILRGFLVDRGMFGRERANFEKLVRINLHFHADKILRGGRYGGEEAAAYLRYCFAICDGYIGSLDLPSGNNDVLGRILGQEIPGRGSASPKKRLFEGVFGKAGR